MRKEFGIFTLLIVMLVCFTSVGMAAPLTNYSVGSFAVDLTARDYHTDVKAAGQDLSAGKYNFDAGFTAGLGNGFAVQYNYVNADTGSIAMAKSTAKANITMNEYNLLYRPNVNMAYFIGGVTGKASANAVSFKDSYGVGSKTYAQFGVVGSQLIGDKVTAYGQLSGGKDIFGWKAGLSYALTNNCDVNFDYTDYKLRSIAVSGASTEVDPKGFGLGLTVKF